MKYKFNLKIQILYGIFGFAIALGIIYLATRNLDWIGSSVVGLINFIISGFYTTN
jgi:hypothetical protein